jgi:hypothetical protein
LETALLEIFRVLKNEDGILVAATNSEHSMSELDELHHMALCAQHRIPSAFRPFSLESGREALQYLFGRVEVHMYEDVMHFTQAEPLVDYYASGWIYRAADGVHRYDISKDEFSRRFEFVHRRVSDIILHEGSFRLRKKLCVFVAHKVVH